MAGRLAIMQPYVFPYLPYFQLAAASQRFVFYDDVAYRPRSWMNRNRILGGDQPQMFTVPVLGASQNVPINEVRVAIDERWLGKFRSTLKHCYGKAPCYADTVELVMSCFEVDTGRFSDVAIASITRVLEYVGMPLNHTRSSVCSPETRGMDKAGRLIAITKGLGFDSYVNPIGGAELYSKAFFESAGVTLGFLQGKPITYPQFSGEFVSGLSIIDVLMFNHPDEIRDYLFNFRIV